MSTSINKDQEANIDMVHASDTSSGAEKNVSFSQQNNSSSNAEIDVDAYMSEREKQQNDSPSMTTTPTTPTNKDTTAVASASIMTSTSSSNGGDDKRLKSFVQGQSEIEQMAERCELRRANRITVTFPVRVAFLKMCRKAANERGTGQKVHITQLKQLRDEQQTKVDSEDVETYARRFFAFWGFRNVDATLLQVLDRAVSRIGEVEGDWLHYSEFIVYDTRLESRWPWMRSGFIGAALAILGFFVFTPVLFCAIIGDENVCPTDPTDQNRKYYGILTAIYFASTTMSTVGYGDVTVSKDTRWSVFIGAIYMLLALTVAITAFSAAAEHAYQRTLTPLTMFVEKIMAKITGTDKLESNALLHEHIRRIKIIKITEIFIAYMVITLIGIFVSRAFVNPETNDIEDQQWNWMTSFYWSIQTTTTVGYGDLDMPFQMRWFQVFYLAFATYFAGAAFGKLGSLKNEIQEIRLQYVWSRREVDKRMLEDMQAYDHDDKVDQYEFVIASLLSLGKISSDDITPIMDKFRKLANKSGYISIDSMPEDAMTRVGAEGGPEIPTGLFEGGVDGKTATEDDSDDLVEDDEIQDLMFAEVN